MNLVLVVVGAVVGMVLGAGFGLPALWLGAVIGGLVGFAVGELRELRSKVAALDEEVRSLRRQMAGTREEKRAAAPEAVAVKREADFFSKVGAPGRGVGTTAPLSAAAAAEETKLENITETPAVSSISQALPGDSRGPAESLISYFRDFFTGGNTVVRVGILILFFGVAFLLRFAAEHSHVPIQLRLSGVAIGGNALLILGWRLRARRTGYALALQGGGIGILYLTTFASLRLYSILPPATGFLLLVFIALCSAALAVIQNSQAFALLAVTGGFLAPILASTGQGSHVVLFSYYAILNASILAMAWYGAWRPLNFAGFAFTFVISAAWGALHYNSELFSSTEPFLILFFLLYVAIAVLFSVRQPPQLKGYVDGTIVFGTPMAAFGYQSGMLHERPLALAVSAVVTAVFYAVLAFVLNRQQRQTQRLLVEAFIALAVVFFTVATPLALNASATGVTWALEGVGLLWIGARQSRTLPRVFGAALQVFVALIQLADVDGFFLVSASPYWGLYLARVITAAAAILSAIVLDKYKQRIPHGAVLFFVGLVEWLLSGLLQIDQYAPHHYRASLALMFVTVTALGSSEISRRCALSVARLPALWLLPAMIVFAAALVLPPVQHPFDYGGWLAWSLAFAAFYLICRRHEKGLRLQLVNGLHAGAIWLGVALLSWQFAWWTDQATGGRGSWVAAVWMVVPAAALGVVLRLVNRVEWPWRTHREAYVLLVGGGLAFGAAFWSLETDISLPGDPFPFPYVPLLNVLDLAQMATLAMLVRYGLYLKSVKSELEPTRYTAGVAALVFIWLNAVLIRTLHRWGGVPFELDAVISSTLVQTSVSIFWTVLALATMLVATRRASRPVWITGASLLAVTVVKLFVIDLSRVGTVERIVSFVGVGLLTLVIGYFSPLPPPATTRQSAT
jgi:uncharacterized membrane protein